MQKERLYNRYTALQLDHVCACITGLQHVGCTGSITMPGGILRRLSVDVMGKVG